MWDCGSARFCICVVAGTGLSMCVSPDCWLLVCLVVTATLATTGHERLRCPAWLRDALTASVLVAAVGLAASERITTECARVGLTSGEKCTLSATVCGFAQPSRTGGSVLVKVGSCRVLVRLKKLPGDLAPGDTITATGVLRSSLGPRDPGGYSEASYLFQQGVWHVLEVPGFLRPWVRTGNSTSSVARTYVSPVRRWIGQSVRRRMTGEERAFLLALILGERGEFSEETKAAFRDSGLVHILSVSGLHTALVGLAALIVLRGIGLRERAAMVGAVVLVWLYCGISGFQPPTVRAGLMLTWMSTSRLAGRSSEVSGPLFSSCAVLLLANPRFLWDPGFQLSYLATASVIMSARVAGRVRRVVRIPDRLWKYAGSTALTTCVAQLGVLPLLALQFGSVSLAAVPANLVGIPLASAGLVCGFCALALEAVLPWVAGLVFDLTWLLLKLCNMTAESASSMPHAVLELSRPHVAEVVAFVACFFVALGLAASGPIRGTKARKALLVFTFSCSAILLARFSGLLPVTALGDRVTDARTGLTVQFLDVGQGDAALIRLPNGKSILVDCGEARPGWDCGQKVLAPCLRSSGLRAVDAAVASHLHSDHAGGLVWPIEKRKVGRVLVSGADTTSCLWKEMVRACSLNRIPLDTVGGSPAAGARLCQLLGDCGVSIRFLHPSGATTSDTSSSSVNDSSVVIVIRHGLARFILTGDAGAKVLDVLADGLREEQDVMTVVKAPHHGAAATLSERFVQAVRPDFVVFSVGRGNRFGHPAKRVVESYERSGAKVLRTDEDGCVRFEVKERLGRRNRAVENPRSGARQAGAAALTVSTAEPRASHPFVRKAKEWRADRALRIQCLLSWGRGRRR